MALVVESMGTHSECSCENPLCTRTEFGIPEKREELRDSSASSESVKIERLLAPFGSQRLGCQSVSQTTLIYSHLCQMGRLVCHNDCVSVWVVAHIPYRLC